MPNLNRLVRKGRFMIIRIFSVLLLCLTLQKGFSQEIIIDTIFVTASRIESNVKSLPISTILISHEEIKTKTLGDVASVLSGEAGIDIRNYSLINGASTISLLASTSQQSLLLLDGLVINSPSLGIADIGLFPVHNLRRIEVVKGPISSLYGANGLAGAVNLITQNPFEITKPIEYDISLNYGSYQTMNFNLSLKTRLEKIGTLFDFYRNQTNGLRTNDDGIAQGFGISSGYHFNQSNRIRIDLRYTTKELGLPGPQPNITDIPIYGDKTATSCFNRQKDTLYLIKILSDFEIRPKWYIKLNGYYSLNNTNFKWIDQFSPDTSFYNEHYSTKVTNLNLFSNYLFTPITNFAWGIDYEYDNFSAQTRDTFWQPQQYKIAVFSEGSLDFGQIFRSFSSLRLDWHPMFGEFISPALGLTAKITPELKFRLHFGRAFRAPTMNDLYWPKSSYMAGNPKIKPESGNTGQLGFDFQNNNISLSTTFFSRKTKNLISWLPPISGDTWQPSNIDNATVVGLELVSKIRLIPGVLFEFSSTLQNAEQIRKEMIYDNWFTNEREFVFQKRKLAYVPSLTFSPGLNIKNDLGTAIDIYGRYVSSRYNYYPNYDSYPKITYQTKQLPSYFVLSLHISQTISSRVNFSLKLENLYDTHYSEQFGNSINDLDYPRQGRSLFVGVEVKD